jgi:hypothetical protein
MRATIALLALMLATQAQGGEITLSCEGVASHFLRAGKERVTGMSLIVDLDDRSVFWNGSREALDFRSDEHTLYFGVSAFANQIEAQQLERPKGPFYFLNGQIDRVTGWASVSQSAISLNETYPDETQYDLLCKSVKPLF